MDKSQKQKQESEKDSDVTSNTNVLAAGDATNNADSSAASTSSPIEAPSLKQHNDLREGLLKLLSQNANSTKGNLELQGLSQEHQALRDTLLIVLKQDLTQEAVNDETIDKKPSAKKAKLLSDLQEIESLVGPIPEQLPLQPLTTNTDAERIESEIAVKENTRHVRGSVASSARSSVQHSMNSSQSSHLAQDSPAVGSQLYAKAPAKRRHLIDERVPGAYAVSGVNAPSNDFEDTTMDAFRSSILGQTTPSSRQVKFEKMAAESNSGIDVEAIINSQAATRLALASKTEPLAIDDSAHSTTGAFNIQSRAFGERPTWNQQTEERTDPESSAEMPEVERSAQLLRAEIVSEPQMVEAEDITKETHQSRYYKYGFICLIVVVGALVAGLSVGLTGGESNVLDPTPPPVYHICEVDPDIFTQCACNNSIYNVSEDLAANYQNISNVLESTVGVNMTNIDDGYSCEASIISRFWMATLPPMTDSDLRNRYALATFYFSTGGGGWNQTNNWISDADVCDGWTGILCQGSSVQSLVLPLSDLEGALPTELGLLTSLQEIDLNNNHLTGTIPTELALLTVLRRFTLHTNFLTGSIPPESFPPDLRNLRLHRNNFTGTLSENFRLPSLRALRFNDNKLTGTIPASFGNFRSIRVVDIAGNRLTGSIPTELSQATTLETVRLYNNSLTGTFPEALADLTSMIVFISHGNQLHGSVPNSYCQNMTSVREMVVTSCENDPVSIANCKCCECWFPNFPFGIDLERK